MERICFVSKHDSKKRISRLPKLRYSSVVNKPISVGIEPVNSFPSIIFFRVESQRDELEAWNESVLFQIQSIKVKQKTVTYSTKAL